MAKAPIASRITFLLQDRENKTEAGCSGHDCRPPITLKPACTEGPFSSAPDQFPRYWEIYSYAIMYWPAHLLMHAGKMESTNASTYLLLTYNYGIQEINGDQPNGKRPINSGAMYNY